MRNERNYIQPSMFKMKVETASILAGSLGSGVTSDGNVVAPGTTPPSGDAGIAHSKSFDSWSDDNSLIYND